MTEPSLSPIAGASASRPDARSTWSHLGYAILDEVITESDAHQMGVGLFLHSTMGRMPRHDGQSDRYFVYRGTLGEELLELCAGLVAQLLGDEVLPTYSYSVVYEPGSNLPAHRDRHACEVSMSIPLALLREPRESAPSSRDWPLFLQIPTGARVSVPFVPGSAVVYKGLEILHSRETLLGARAVVVLLHYVLKHGRFPDHANDFRPPCCQT